MNLYLIASLIANAVLGLGWAGAIGLALYNSDLATTWHQKYNDELERRLDAEREFARAKEIFLPHKDN